MRHAWLALGIALGSLAGAASAQPLTVASQSSVDLARGLEAQHQAALIRERRVADDREARLLDSHEAQLRDARARFDRGIAGAQAELEQARLQFATYVEEVAARDSGLRAEIEAYRAEARGLAQRASPELAAAYQRFADGDRVGAWPVIEQLTQAQVRATMAAAGARAAVTVRDAAQARETMRLRGEATAADVLALWRQAAQLDPSDAHTHLSIAAMAYETGDLTSSRTAAEAALATASDDETRVRSLILLTRAVDYGGDLATARRYADDAVAGARRVLSVEPNAAERQALLVDALARQSQTLARQRDSAALMTSAVEAERIARTQARANPDSVAWMNRFVLALDDLGLAHRLQSAYPQALAAFREELALSERLAASDPNSVEYRRNVAFSHENIGMMLLSLGDPQAALASFRQRLAGFEALAALDPTSMAHQRNILVSHNQIAGTLRALGDTEGARRSHLATYELAQRLLAHDPSSIVALADVHGAAYNLALVAQDVADHATAQSRLEEALTLARRMVAADPNSTETRIGLTTVLGALGSHHLRVTQDYDMAEGHFAEWQQVNAPLRARLADDADFLSRHALTLMEYANLAGVRNDRVGARARLEEAEADTRRLLAIAPDNVSNILRLAFVRNSQGYYAVQDNDWPAARTAYRECIELIQRAPDGAGAAPRGQALTECQRGAVIAFEHEFGDVEGGARDEWSAAVLRATRTHATAADAPAGVQILYAWDVFRRAVLLHFLGRQAEAEALLWEAEAIAARNPSGQDLLAQVETRLSNVAGHYIDNPQEGLRLVNLLLARRQNGKCQYVNLTYAAMYLLATGDAEGSRRRRAEALECARALGEAGTIANALFDAAEAGLVPWQEVIAHHEQGIASGALDRNFYAPRLEDARGRARQQSP
jgi:tetratricopeptide (TPR) repeat protein